MAISFVEKNTDFGQAGSVTTPAGDCAFTPTLPTGTASGDRVFMLQTHDIASAASPSGWAALYKDRVIGSGAAGSGVGQRWQSCHYRDYDGAWSMPSMALTSSTNISQKITVITLRKAAGETWDTPTVSNAVNSYGTPSTTHSLTTSTFATTVGGWLIAHGVNNDGTYMSLDSLSGTNGLAHSGVTQRTYNTSDSMGADISTAAVSTAASPAGTATLGYGSSVATEAGASLIQQTVSAATATGGFFMAS